MEMDAQLCQGWGVYTQTWEENEGGDVGITENADEEEVPLGKKWKEVRRG